MTTSHSDLLAKISAALTDPVMTAKALIELAERALAAEALAGLSATEARQRALAPTLCPERVPEALHEATAAAFVAERLATARAALNTLWETRLKEQTEAARVAARDHAIAERDRCAARLVAEYPALQAQLVNLLADVMQTNEAVDQANRAKSDADQNIQRPEGLAREFFDRDEDGDAPYNYEIIRLTQALLPDFADPTITAWPPGRTHGQMQQTRFQPLNYGQLRWLFNKSKAR